MSEENEKKTNRGGARAGSGRKKTGLLTKNYTIHLPLDVAEEMEKRAAQLNKTVNRYLRDIIEASGQYGNICIEGKHVDENSTSENGHYVYEVITEKKYEFEENGHKGFKSETFVRRWEPEEKRELLAEEKEELMAADKEAPYVIDKHN